MVRLAVTSFSFFALGFFLQADTNTLHPSLSVQERVRDIFENSSDCVVRVKATRKDEVDEKVSRVLKMGSGFFVSKGWACIDLWITSKC